jgi:hypothetical protein
LKNPPSAAEYTHTGIPGARLDRMRAWVTSIPQKIHTAS